MTLLHPTYFSPIIQYVAIAKSKQIIFEVEDNFQKQTYRNRCYIFGANGKQLLNIPIQKISGKQVTKEVKIDYSYNWQLEHLKTLHSAYSSSPFFEYYIDDLLPLFKRKKTYLVDLNIKTLDIILNVIEESTSHNLTNNFKKNVLNDYRFLVNAKENIHNELPKYTQVFDNKHGFLSNLSILDLLFMEGPASLNYLDKVGLMSIKHQNTL